MKKTQTNSFSIAHYILLFLVIVVGIWFIIWAIASIKDADAGTKKQHVSPENCIEQVTQTVTQMWTDSPDMVPQKYITMMNDRANRIVDVRTRGNCNGITFICEMGAIRSECDPCAVTNARQMAIEQHTVDMIKENCNVVQ